MNDTEKTNDELVFYNMQTGQVVTDKVYKALANHDTKMLRDGTIGFMNKKQAQIVDGFVVNRVNSTQQVQSTAVKPKTPNIYTAERRVMTESEKRNYQRAKSQSHTSVKRSTKRNRNNRKNISQAVVAVGMSAVLAISTYATLSKLTQNISEKKHLRSADAAISSLLVQPNSRLTPDIVERNTHRTDDFQSYWYDNEGIAEDILKLPDELFDAALYDVYVTMGANRKNNYINNLDYVISSLNQNATPENNPLAFARVNGCMTFNEFLQKNGLVDDKRLPSEERYLEFGRNAIEMYYQYLNSIKEDRNNGTESRNASNEIAYGGR